MCNRRLTQTAISLSSCEAEFYAASVCAGELLGLAELFKELQNNASVRLEMDSDSAAKRTEIRCLAIRIIERRLSVGHVNTKDKTADLFTKHLDGPRTRSLAREIGLQVLGGTGGE